MFSKLSTRAVLDRPIDVRCLIAALVCWLGADQILLWHFLGRATWPIDGIGAVIVVAVIFTIWRTVPRGGPSARTVLLCLVIAAALLALGGEGRLAYANRDWMVRDAVLRDMASHQWPFAYTARGVVEILRCPLGMYLVPALVLKVGGQGAGDAALLMQNAILVGVVLALTTTLFASTRERLLAVGIFVAFSGLDGVGAALSGGARPWILSDHLEWWAAPLQFSSHVTQLFWVPQHALAGWICAIGYLLWNERRLPLGVFLGFVPLTILWSPLAAFGAIPFAGVAIATTFRRGTLRRSDVIVPGLATASTLPALAYLSASSTSVGAAVATTSPATYAIFEILEVLPFLVPLVLGVTTRRFGRPTLYVVAVLLFALPFARIGWSSDLMMRASIPALAILAVMTAHAVIAEPRRDLRAMLVVVLAIGMVTGLHEIARALTWPVSPSPLCTFYHAWGPGPADHKSTYLAPVATLPAMIRAERYALVPPADPARCWSRPWPQPRGI